MYVKVTTLVATLQRLIGFLNLNSFNALIESFVRVLMNGINCANEENNLYTSTAIQSLLCNNQKVVVKCICLSFVFQTFT